MKGGSNVGEEGAENTAISSRVWRHRSLKCNSPPQPRWLFRKGETLASQLSCYLPPQWLIPHLLSLRPSPGLAVLP